MRRSPTARAHGSCLVLASLMLAGCAHVDTGPAFQDVRGRLSERTAPTLEWAQETRPLQLEEPTLLSRDDVVRLALLHNPGLQATLEELGVSAADRVQAGRLQNPRLQAAVRPATGGGSGTNIELGLAQNLLQIFTLKARKRLAAAELEETKLRVAQSVLNLARDTDLSYLDLVAAQQKVEVCRTIRDAAATGYELAQRFYDAGNVNELQLRREQGLVELAEVELLAAERDATRARRALRDLLGASGDTERRWQVGSRLPDVAPETFDAAVLELQAVEERFDLQAAAQEVRTLEMALGLNRRWRLLGGLEVEASAEREVDGEWVLGPGIDIELPLFDQGQPRVARSEARLRQAERAFEARVVEARSEVLQLVDQLDLEQRMAGRYLQHVIPLRQRTVRLAQEQYNFMLIGVFEVLAAKRDEFDAYSSYIDTVRDVWKTRSRLRYAVGGRLAEPPFDAGQAPAKEPDTEHEHHNHSGGQR